MKSCFLKCQPGDIAILDTGRYLCRSEFIDKWHPRFMGISVFPGYVDVTNMQGGGQGVLLLGIDSPHIRKIIKKK